MAARNLPSTTSWSRTGMVVSSSRVPVRTSSATRRMVMAGAKITRSSGVIEKKLRRLLAPARNTVEK
jgi:hypothetical protein